MKDLLRFILGLTIGLFIVGYVNHQQKRINQYKELNNLYKIKDSLRQIDYMNVFYRLDTIEIWFDSVEAEQSRKVIKNV